MANNQNLDLSGISFEAPEGAVQVQSRSGRYKPAVCKTVDAEGNDKFFPLRGLVNAAVFRQSKDPKKKDYYDLELRLTAPTYACSGKDDTLERFEKGDTILIAATESLKPWIDVARRENPESIPEIFLVPVREKDLGSNQTMWEYAVSVVGKHDPSTVSSLSALLAEKPQIAAAIGAAPAAPVTAS